MGPFVLSSQKGRLVDIGKKMVLNEEVLENLGTLNGIGKGVSITMRLHWCHGDKMLDWNIHY